MKIVIVILILSFNIFPQDDIRNKFFIGIVAGNPINVIATAGVFLKDFGIRLSGGVWLYKRYGIQADYSYILFQDNSFQHRISFFSAYSHNRKVPTNAFFYYVFHTEPEIDFEYVNSFYCGIAYNFIWKGVFIQAGPAWGTGNFKNARLIGQVGYIHFFE